MKVGWHIDAEKMWGSPSHQSSGRESCPSFDLAIFKPALQPVAFAIGLLSVVSFLYLAWSVGQYNALLVGVVVVDIVALVCLLAGAAAYIYMQRKP